MLGLPLPTCVWLSGVRTTQQCFDAGSALKVYVHSPDRFFAHVVLLTCEQLNNLLAHFKTVVCYTFIESCQCQRCQSPCIDNSSHP